MATLVETRSTGGKLILTDTMISVELSSLRSQTLSREAFTALDYKLASPSAYKSLFGNPISSLYMSGFKEVSE